MTEKPALSDEGILLAEASMGVSPSADAAASLLISHRAGNESAFRELIDMFRSQVFTYLVRCGVDHGARDDLFQEIFLTLHQSSGSFDSSRPLAPWLFTIVANSVRSHFRKKNREGSRLSDQKADEKRSPENVHAASEARETAAWLQSAVLTLPLEEREVFLLCCIKDIAQKEAAEILKIPLNTVKTHVRRARLKLAKQLLVRNSQMKEEVPV